MQEGGGAGVMLCWKGRGWGDAVLGGRGWGAGRGGAGVMLYWEGGAGVLGGEELG